MSGDDGRAPAAKELLDRSHRNQLRYLAWLQQHPQAATELTCILVEHGPVAFDQLHQVAWAESQRHAYAVCH